jgi:cytochrome c2
MTMFFGLLGLLLIVGDGCNRAREDTSGLSVNGNARHGAALISQVGCGSCHSIKGISGADGLVGPPLDTIGRRVIIAGLLPNTPENLVAWLKDPQKIVPGNAMPDMGLNERQARDIAAYLYTLR